MAKNEELKVTFRRVSEPGEMSTYDLYKITGLWPIDFVKKAVEEKKNAEQKT